MEASTGYTKWPEQGVAERIHAYGIRPKLVYVVRDPFARIESHYNFVLHDPAWEARGMTHESLVQNSDYAAWADAYAAVFGAENLLLLDYAELVADPTRAVNRVAAFLGIAPMAAVADTSARNVTERPRSGLERRNPPPRPRPRQRRPGGAEAAGPRPPRRPQTGEGPDVPGRAGGDRRLPLPGHGAARQRLRLRRRPVGLRPRAAGGGGVGR